MLNRESTYPVAAPKDNWKFVLPALDSGMARTDFERDGINYFFPPVPSSAPIRFST